MDEQKSLEAPAKTKRAVSEKVMENLKKAQARKRELDEERKKQSSEKRELDKRRRKVDNLKKQLVLLTAEDYSSEDEPPAEVKVVTRAPPKVEVAQASQKAAPKIVEKPVPKPAERLSMLFI